MSETVICVDGLSKQYRIGERERYLALRDALARAFTAPFRRNGRHSTEDYLWALSDMSFEVKRGEVVGLIGRNGAGKSTLLKVLSRITRPTAGRAEIRGRVGSLLEVGTGFHPELTGRENIYLNGAILGMRKDEINRKFNEIVAFAEVDRFLDTPLKHYSSGMQVRLAFAVAAHLEPEILLVDEVLSVGDIAFQRKCLGRMEDVTRSGRTILFVSHQLNQIRRLCQRCIWIDGGKLRLAGSMQKVVTAYETSFSLRTGQTSDSSPSHHGTRFLGWRIAEPINDEANVLDGFGNVTLEFSLSVDRGIQYGVHGIALFNSDHQLIWATSVNGLDFCSGRHILRFRLPSLALRPGVYHWEVSIWEGGHCLDRWACVPDMIVATAPVTHPQEEWQGVLNLPWEFQAERDLDSDATRRQDRLEGQVE